MKKAGLAILWTCLLVFSLSACRDEGTVIGFPVADAGPDQNVTTGDTVTLDGSGSTNALTFDWSFVSRPGGSSAVLANAQTAQPSFTADRSGRYVVQLVVGNGRENSVADTVTITATALVNTPPVANAGSDQNVNAGATVTLDGSASSDADGDPLTYQWTLTTVPAGSTAALTDATTATPRFVADVAGTYVATLVVNDGTTDSAPATVTVTATAVPTNTPPVADAGTDQSVTVGTTVTLDGSASTDADGDPLTYQWTLTTVPAGSTAALTGATTATPRFVADVAGTYVATLVVNDGTADSPPASVTITATVPSRSWQAAFALSSTLANKSHIHNAVAVDGQGNFFVAWIEHDTAAYTQTLYVRRYDAATGAWETPVAVAHGVPNPVWEYGLGSSVTLLADDNGNAMLLWAQESQRPFTDATGVTTVWANQIFFSRYTAASAAWTPPEFISRDVDASVVESSIKPVAAMDGNGNVFAAWIDREHDSNINNTLPSLVARRFNAQTGSWEPQVRLETSSGPVYFEPAVAADVNGNAVVVWNQDDGTATSLAANRYDAATGSWGTAVWVESSALPVDSPPDVVMDAAGNATAMWFEIDYTGPFYHMNVMSSRLDGSTGTWSTPVTVESGSEFDASVMMSRSIDLAADDAGNVWALWLHRAYSYAVSSRIHFVHASRFDAGTGTWSTPEGMQTTLTLTRNARTPVVSVDPASGDAIALWSQLDWDGSKLVYRILANRFASTGGAWGTAGVIGSGPYNAETPRLAVASTGEALATWLQFVTPGGNVVYGAFSR